MDHQAGFPLKMLLGKIVILQNIGLILHSINRLEWAFVTIQFLLWLEPLFAHNTSNIGGQSPLAVDLIQVFPEVANGGSGDWQELLTLVTITMSEGGSRRQLEMRQFNGKVSNNIKSYFYTGKGEVKMARLELCFRIHSLTMLPFWAPWTSCTTSAGDFPRISFLWY